MAISGKVCKSKYESTVQKGVIGCLHEQSIQSKSGKACPCCRRYIPKTSHGHDVSDDNESNDNEWNIFGSLQTDYEVTAVIGKGWLHKKGTGKDWMGSRSWKPRWVQLVLASIEGCDVEIPLLFVYWNPSMPLPSNIINLVSTVIIPIDKDEDMWSTFAFDVVHVGDSNCQNHHRARRTFAAPPKERNEWVNIINTTLQDFEKRKNKKRVESAFNRLHIRKLELPPSSTQNKRPMSPIIRPTTTRIRPGEERFFPGLPSL